METPNIQSIEVKTYRETWICPQADCGGQMIATGTVLCIMPPKYEHKCNLCGFTDHANDCYPRITYK